VGALGEDTLHDTAVLLVPLTFGVNCWVPPTCNVAEFGDMLIVTIGELPPPRPPVPPPQDMRHKDHIRAAMNPDLRVATFASYRESVKGQYHRSNRMSRHFRRVHFETQREGRFVVLSGE
jgi:hypothetical protein